MGGAAGSAAGPAGTAIGSKLGGAIGGKVGGGNSGGPSNSSMLSLGMGAMQQLQALGLKNKANAAMPDLVDPNQASYLAELAQKRKSIDTGADFSEAMNAIDTQNASTNEAITRNTGGDVSGTIQALLQSERVAGDSKNQAIAQGQQQQMAYNQMFEGLMNKISARSLQLQMYKSQQARAEWAQKQQLANQNMMAALAGTMSGNPTSAGTKVADIATPVIKGGPGVKSILDSFSKVPPAMQGGTKVTNNEQPVIDDATLGGTLS